MPAPAPSPKIENDPDVLTYVVGAPFYNEKGEHIYVLHYVGDMEKVSTFNAKGMKSTFKSMILGHRYAIPTRNGGKTFVFGQMKWLGQHDDQQWRLEQAALAELREDERKREEMMKSLAKSSELDKAIEPLRDVYWKLPYSRRDAFELIVLNKLREARISNGKLVRP